MVWVGIERADCAARLFVAVQLRDRDKARATEAPHHSPEPYTSTKPYIDERQKRKGARREAIAPARLKVVPFATRCVACQAAQEGFRRAA